jgi:hypothetical protein
MSVPGKRTKTELKEIAQEIIMDGIAKTLGYTDPTDSGYPMTGDELETFRAIMKREADRVAKLFGYEEAWRA